MKNKDDPSASRLVARLPDAQAMRRFSVQRNDHAECGNPDCSRHWLVALKDRRRPVFEGEWGCCARCVGAIVNAAIRRETADREPDPKDIQHRHRMPLGLILLAHGWITHAQLQHALDAQRRAGYGRIGRWLVEECGVEQEHVTRALGIQWGCPALTADGFNPHAMALAVPKLLLESFGAVPIRIAGDRIFYLGFADRPNASAAFAIGRMSGLKAESGIVASTDWIAAWKRLSACESVEAMFEQCPNIETMSRKMVSSLVGNQPRAARMVRLHQFYWMRMWLETGAMSTRGGGIPKTKQDVVDAVYTVATEQ